jgi:hypothetical protein
MRTSSHRHDLRRIRSRSSTSIPYSDWRSASTMAQRVRISAHVTRDPDRSSRTSSGYSYHS